MTKVEPILVHGDAGWIAKGSWGGVFGVTKEDAVRLFYERARFHEELLHRSIVVAGNGGSDEP
jgi:hypothetical protein